MADLIPNVKILNQTVAQPQVELFHEGNLPSMTFRMNGFMRTHPKVLGMDVKQGIDPGKLGETYFYGFILYVI